MLGMSVMDQKGEGDSNAWAAFPAHPYCCTVVFGFRVGKKVCVSWEVCNRVLQFKCRLNAWYPVERMLAVDITAFKVEPVFKPLCFSEALLYPYRDI